MILVLDFGSQYTHLITRKLRELGANAQIFPSNLNPSQIPPQTKGIILSGGPSSVYDHSSPSFNKKLLNLNTPILGICYDHQLIAHLSGAEVKPGKVREYGKKEIKIKKSKLLEGLNPSETVWYSHSDDVTSLPKGFKVTALSGQTIAGFENGHLFGVQFHPEVNHTQNGQKVLKNFIKISSSQNTWNKKDQIQTLINEIKDEVKDENVLIGVSGGVDSLVASALLNKAIQNNLYCVFIDTGLMRKGEASEVAQIYKELNFKHFLSFDASANFFKALKNITDPEQKRKIIGHLFIKTFEKISKLLKKDKKIKFLAQGTIYPDRIESASSSVNAQKIKPHHNLTLPDKLNLKILEPLKDFYKDEVRSLGKKLGLSKSFLERHPFPGPGLGIRILGEITKDRLNILKEADAIYIEQLKKQNLYNSIWQAFAALIPVKTVGVMGDNRTYEYIITLRAVTSDNGMTADWAKIPNLALEKISSRIVNEVRGVNRVVYDITQKPPSTIEYE